MTATSGNDQVEHRPESLKDLRDGPVFWLRPMTGRILPRYRHALRSAGLQFHVPADIRAEMLVALANLWTPSTFDEQSARLQVYWDAADQLEEALRQWRAAGGQGEAPTIGIDDAEVAAIVDLQRRLSENWPRLARMAADNSLFLEESPRVALSLVLAGWSGIDVPFALEQGEVPMATIDAIEKALGKVERDAQARSIDIVGEGFAFLSLLARATKEMNLSGDEEKNSPSPSPAPSTPNGSTTTSSGEMGDNAGSTASEPSPETPSA